MSHCCMPVEKLPYSVCGEPTMTFLLKQDETDLPVCDQHLPAEAREICEKLREMERTNIR